MVYPSYHIVLVLKQCKTKTKGEGEEKTRGEEKKEEKSKGNKIKEKGRKEIGTFFFLLVYRTLKGTGNNPYPTTTMKANSKTRTTSTKNSTPLLCSITSRIM